MIKPGLSSLFHSRWLALAWALVICAAAISFVAALGIQERSPAPEAPVNAAQ